MAAIEPHGEAPQAAAEGAADSDFRVGLAVHEAAAAGAALAAAVARKLESATT
jgi:hypothetical protein